MHCKKLDIVKTTVCIVFFFKVASNYLISKLLNMSSVNQIVTTNRYFVV